ncbi:MAG: hypothetical protein JKX82_04945 [Oleispira sp.]|nr:hypothetical protein [Oleispira sp.]
MSDSIKTRIEIAQDLLIELGLKDLSNQSKEMNTSFWKEIEREYIGQFKNLSA